MYIMLDSFVCARGVFIYQWMDKHKCLHCYCYYYYFLNMQMMINKEFFHELVYTLHMMEFTYLLNTAENWSDMCWRKEYYNNVKASLKIWLPNITTLYKVKYTVVMEKTAVLRMYSVNSFLKINFWRMIYEPLERHWAQLETVF